MVFRPLRRLCWTPAGRSFILLAIGNIGSRHMKYKHLFCAALVAVPASLAFAQQEAVDDALFRGTLDDYCTGCHNIEDWAGGVAFDMMDADQVPHDAVVWEEVMRKMRGRLMPPPGSPQPEQEQIDAFVAAMEGTLDAHGVGPSAGHVPIQR